MASSEIHAGRGMGIDVQLAHQMDQAGMAMVNGTQPGHTDRAPSRPPSPDGLERDEPPSSAHSAAATAGSSPRSPYTPPPPAPQLSPEAWQGRVAPPPLPAGTILAGPWPGALNEVPVAFQSHPDLRRLRAHLGDDGDLSSLPVAFCDSFVLALAAKPRWTSRQIELAYAGACLQFFATHNPPDGTHTLLALARERCLDWAHRDLLPRQDPGARWWRPQR